VVAVSHGRRVHQLIDTPSFGRPVRVRWAKRTWSCPEPACPVGSFTEQDERVAAPRALLTARACWWAIGQLRREHASVAELARQLGTTWSTVWRAVKPLLVVMAADPTRFDRVEILGVDEHIWHHVSTKTRGPKELTGMVDLTRDEHGNTRARLLDLVPGRSGSVYRDPHRRRAQRRPPPPRYEEPGELGDGSLWLGSLWLGSLWLGSLPSLALLASVRARLTPPSVNRRASAAPPPQSP